MACWVEVVVSCGTQSLRFVTLHEDDAPLTAAFAFHLNREPSKECAVTDNGCLSGAAVALSV